ncbi:hypothetical protein SAMN05660826_02334 [Caldanaerovirga acetigignens]|uniref:Uncharacterized protein n=1 Tax=Caldanaerovirga acetigignens TaxID=447595 RepID=A0A1M7MLB9_9FIRM|nr:hypothetical protein [Caldanaerovirga acetigignens]SHM91672.1 hypothetical protein SAMN05660826_02334 [Caldanaerovirga acetigignens]
MKKKNTVTIALVMILIASIIFLIYRQRKSTEAELFLNDWEGYICASNNEVFLLQIPWFVINKDIKLSEIKFDLLNLPDTAEIIKKDIELRYSRENISQYLINFYIKIKTPHLYKNDNLNLIIEKSNVKDIIPLGRWVFEIIPYEQNELRIREHITMSSGKNIDYPYYMFVVENKSNQPVTLNDIAYDSPNLTKINIKYDDNATLENNEWKDFPIGGLTLAPFSSKAVAVFMESKNPQKLYALKPKIIYSINDKIFEMPGDMYLVIISMSKEDIIRKAMR